MKGSGTSAFYNTVTFATNLENLKWPFHLKFENQVLPRIWLQSELAGTRAAGA